MMTEIRCSKNLQSIAVTKDIAKREDQDNLSDQNIFPVHRYNIEYITVHSSTYSTVHSTFSTTQYTGSKYSTVHSTLFSTSVLNIYIIAHSTLFSTSVLNIYIL